MRPPTRRAGVAASTFPVSANARWWTPAETGVGRHAPVAQADACRDGQIEIRSCVRFDSCLTRTDQCRAGLCSGSLNLHYGPAPPKRAVLTSRDPGATPDHPRRHHQMATTERDGLVNRFGPSCSPVQGPVEETGARSQAEARNVSRMIANARFGDRPRLGLVPRACAPATHRRDLPRGSGVSAERGSR
jgi:hypothetical protein